MGSINVAIIANEAGKDLSEAIFTHPNKTYKVMDVPHLGAIIQRAMTHDDLGRYLPEVITKASSQTDDIVGTLHKWCSVRTEGTTFGGVPLNLEPKLEVWDSPDSASVVIDAACCARPVMDRGVSGALKAPSACFMKSPAAVHGRRGATHGRVFHH